MDYFFKYKNTRIFAWYFPKTKTKITMCFCSIVSVKCNYIITTKRNIHQMQFNWSIASFLTNFMIVYKNTNLNYIVT